MYKAYCLENTWQKQLEMDKSSDSISRAIGGGLLVVVHVKNLHNGSLPPILKEIILLKLTFLPNYGKEYAMHTGTIINALLSWRLV